MGGVPQATKGMFLTRVLANEPLCRDHWRLVIEVDGFPDAQPGQFVQVLCSDPDDDRHAGGAYIRRPFSMGGLRRQGDRCEIDILHRVVGVGTRWLSRLQPGDSVSIIGPLGKPFQLFDDHSVAYLVGGGIGLPPLVWMAESLKVAGKRAVAFCGARTADLMPLSCEATVPSNVADATPVVRDFAQFDTPSIVCTDDGTLGVSGLIPDVFERYLQRHAADAARSAVVYTCGPDPMMRAVAEICQHRSIRCQVCLERMMACGMATCQSCVVRVRDKKRDEGWGYRLCCTDGPVFDAADVFWDS